MNTAALSLAWMDEGSGERSAERKHKPAVAPRQFGHVLLPFRQLSALPEGMVCRAGLLEQQQFGRGADGFVGSTNTPSCQPILAVALARSGERTVPRKLF